MVTARTVNRTVLALRVLQVGMVIFIGATLWSLLRSRPIVESSTSTQLPTPTAIDSSAGSDDLPPLDHFAVLWQRSLRQPLVDPVATPEPTPPPAPRRPLPRLLSTVVSGKRPLAQIAPQQGPPRILGMSEEIDGYAVASIESGRVLLVRGDAEHWIEIQRPEPLIAERP